MCEDLIGCDHEPETPVSEDGEIIAWLCRCGIEWPLPIDFEKWKKPMTDEEP